MVEPYTVEYAEIARDYNEFERIANSEAYKWVDYSEQIECYSALKELKLNITLDTMYSMPDTDYIVERNDI